MALFTIVLYSTFLFLAVISEGEADIQCYACTVLPVSQSDSSKNRLCVNFNQGQEYVVNCPYSTMCMKRTFKYTLQDGVLITGVERDCAKQLNKYHKLNDNATEWVEVSDIVERYQDGCQATDDIGEKSVSTVYCYCRSHLCNNANKNTDSYHSDTMAVILIFNLLKYIKSLT